METFNYTGEMKECELEERETEVKAMISRGEKIVVAHREIDTRGCECKIFPYYPDIRHKEHGSDGMVRFVLSRPITGAPVTADSNGFVPPSSPSRYPPDEQDFKMKSEDFAKATERVRFGTFLHVLGIRKKEDTEGRWLALGFYASHHSPLGEQSPERVSPKNGGGS